MSNLNDAIKMRGDLVITKTAENGSVETVTVPNLVVTVGKGYIANRMSANVTNIMSHMAIGSGNTAPTTSDTIIEAELARVVLSVAGGTPSQNTVTYSATFPAGTGTGALTEAGVLNAANVGTLLCRTVFPVINKQAADVIAISWVVSIT
jgi:hypothetical protein